jgi:3',5'-cyclic AMP phosphodiesterase CpdA
MLSLGDQTESDTESELQDNFFNQLQGVLKTTPLYPIAGNRESTDKQVSYKATFSVPALAEAGGYPSGTKDYYSFNYGNIHVVALSVENSVSASGAQKTWLQNDLANNKSDWLIAFMHQPMHSTGYALTEESSTILSQKSNWLPLLEAAGVDLILAGHKHFYERSYLVDNLTGTSASITNAHKIDTALGRVDVDHAYYKELGKPHQGTIFITCEGAGNSSKGTYVPAPNCFFPVVVKGDLNEGSLVIDVDGRNRMDVRFLCDEPDTKGTNVWDHFTIIKSQKATSVAQTADVLPGEFSITNYPNPFNPSTKIRYSLPATEFVNIGIFDLLGRNVYTIAGGMKEKGTYTFDWDARDEQGTRLPGGIYIVRISSNQRSGNTKMLLLR